MTQALDRAGELVDLEAALAADGRLGNVTMVSASAGTGKTYTLTGKIAKKIGDGVPAGAVMATTFTKKAAGELRERIAARLLDSGESGSALQTASQQLGAALIGTVNSVCGQLLAEYAIDAGLSPAIEVIAEDQLAGIFRLATDEVLASHAPEMLPIAHRLGADGTGGRDAATWEETVRAVVDAARTNRVRPEDLPAMAERSWVGMRELLDEPGEDHRGQWLRELQALLPDLDSMTATGRSAAGRKVDTASDSFRTAVPKIRTAIASMRDINDVPWETWRGIVPSKAPAAVKTLFTPVNESFKGTVLANPALHADLEGYIRGIFACAKECLDAYREFKDTHGLMDFVDQESRVLDLARGSEAFRRAFTERIRFLVVDEFQDTSPLQLALFLELSGLVEEAVWVGDPKQAIYEFRGTDPELMEAVVRRVSRREQLSHTWRSHQLPVDLSNGVFEQVFEAAGMDRASVTLTLPPERAVELAGRPGSLEAWTRPQGNDGERLRATAAGVKALLERRGDLAPSDVAVLARSNKDVADLSAALDELGLRASVNPRGLGGAREIQLARAAMAYVADGYDTAALTELVALHPGHASHGTWQRELLGGADPAAALEEWNRDALLTALDGLRAAAKSATPTEVFESVVGVLGLPRLIAGWSAPETRLRNLDAFRGVIARYYERCRALRTAATLRGFLGFFGSEDAAGAENSGPDVVTVLTYHKAKGLEWPVVVMESLDKDLRFNALGAAVEQDGALDLADPLAGRWIRLWPTPFPYGGSPLDRRAAESAVAQRAEERERRNGSRLMYVGMTRSKETTVLTAKSTRSELLNKLGVADLVSWSEAGIEVAGREVLPARFESLEPQEPAAHDARWEPRWVDAPMAGAGVVPCAERKPARLTPSAVDSAGLEAAVREAAVLGGALASHGSDDWGAVGSAVHAYLGTEFRALDASGREALAERLVQRWGVGQTVEAALLTTAGERFESWLDSEFPGWTRHREAAIGWRPEGQAMEGWIDLLLEGQDGFVLVDHKTYPGTDPVGHIQASYLGQMDTYRRAVEAATGRPVLRVLMHLPALGKVFEVELPAGAVDNF